MKTNAIRFLTKSTLHVTALLGMICATFLLAPAAWSQTTTNYTTAGNATWTCPANVYTLQVETYGGGGGGGGCAATPNYTCAGGGAGGSYVIYTLNVTPGTAYNLIVGAAGTGGPGPSTAGSASAVAGGNGGSSCFGNTSSGATNGAAVLAVGGLGGVGNFGLTAGSSGNRTGGPAGGLGTTAGNLPISGTAGTSGGAGVGGANTGTAHSGAGGAGAGPSGGAGGAAVFASGTAGVVGSPGTAPGGGGSGGEDGTAARAGGAGGAGKVVLTYIINTNIAGSSTVAASPTSIPADGTTTSTITVTLKDAASVAITNKTVTLASSRGATDTISPASAVTSTSGVATFTVKSTSGGSGVFTATDTTDSITVSQTATVTFLAGSVTIDHFTVTPSAGSGTAGQVLTATVQAYSTNGIISDSSVDGIAATMTSSGSAQFDANGDGTYGDSSKSLTNGTFTINFRDLKAESITLTATQGTNTGTSSSVSISAGAVAQLQLLLPGETATPGVSPGKTGTTSAKTSGTGFSVTVNAVDTNYNVASSSDNITLTAANDASAVLPATTALSGGTVTLSVTNIIAGGGRTLTATDSSNGGITASTSPAYVVVPGAAAKMLVLAPGESATFGAAPGKTGSPSTEFSTVGYSVTVDLLDANYNLVTNGTDTVGISSSTGGDTLPANAALVAGTKTFSLTNNSVATVTLTATNVTQGTAVATGTSSVPVSINSTTTAVASSSNPANEGQTVAFTATVSGSGTKTGNVTFKNGTNVLGSSTVSANTATFALSGGAGTYSITAIYSGDSNNTGSTSGALSQVIQVGSGVATPAAMEDGMDYTPAREFTNGVTLRGPWSVSTASTSAVSITNLDMFGITSPDIKPIANTNNVSGGSHLRMNLSGAAQREVSRPIGTTYASGSVYFSMLMGVTSNALSDQPIFSMLASGLTNFIVPTDPLILHEKPGLDAFHFNLGISSLGGSTNYATNELYGNYAAGNQPVSNYLVVVKYNFAGTASLYVNPTPGNPEPTPSATVSAGVATPPANIGTILFYEDGNTRGTNHYDTMRVDSSWYNVTPPFGSSGLGATKLAFTPSSQIIQVSHTSSLITVTLEDQSNNTFTATSDTLVSLSSTSGGATFLSGADGVTPITSVTISNGTSTATFYYNDSSSGTPTITGANGLLTPATQIETITPNLARLGHFTITPSTSSTTAGTVFTATVQAYDTNNVAITDSGFDGLPITFTGTGLAQFDANANSVYGDNIKALASGAVTINVRDIKAQSITLTGGVGTNTATSSSITISASSFAGLELLLPGETSAPGTTTGRTGTPSTVTAGIPFSITVKAVDAYWNSVSATDTVHITQTGDADVILPADTALSGGTVTLTVTNILTGSGQNLAVTDASNGGITGDTSSAYTVVSGTAVRLVAVAPGESVTFGVAPGKTGTPGDQLQTGNFNITVYALDAYYNLATTCSDIVGITSTDGAATLPANAALVGGTKSFVVKNNTQGSVTDTASDLSTNTVAAGSVTLIIDPIQNFRSAQSGLWSDTNTWVYSSDSGVTWVPATNTPSAALTAVVEITNGITVTVASSVTVSRTTVESNAAVSVQPGVILNVASGAGNDLDVFGTLTNSGAITNGAGGTIKMENFATYYHNQSGGNFMPAVWETNSTLDVIGWTTNTTVSAATGVKQKFGNFTWNSPGQTAQLSFGSSTLTNVSGNFTVVNTGSSALALCLGASFTTKIGGNLNVTGGTLYAATSGGGTEVVTIAGDVNISGGTVNLETGGAGTELVTWNIGGNLNVSGGTFTANDTNDWPQVNFTNAGTHKIVISGSGSIPSTSDINWEVYPGATLDLASQTLGGNGLFVTDAGAGLATTRSNGFAGNLTFASTNLSLSTAGNYIYYGSVAQSGDTNLPATVGGLTVSNSTGVTLPAAVTATSVNLTGKLTGSSISIASGGSFTATSPSTVVGNVTMNSGGIVLVASSNTLPALTVQGGAMAFSASPVTLTLSGSPLPQGSYLLVDANSGGSVSGTPAFTATVNGSGLTPGLVGRPAVSGGKLYLNVPEFYALADNLPGLFGGDNLFFTNAPGIAFYLWSTTNPYLAVSNWTLEGPMSGQPLNDGSGLSRYVRNVNPSLSPTYYFAATTNIGPYLISPVSATILTSDDFIDFTMVISNVTISTTGVLGLAPAIPPAATLSAVTTLSNGAFQFQFGGPVSQPYTILTSTDLVNWITNSTGTISSSPVTVTDTSATNSVKKFYQVRFP